MRFAAAPEYHVFPTRERPLTPYEAVERATRDTVALVRDVAPDAVVSDILTLAPALAGELEGVPRRRRVIPHVDPRMPPGSAPYSCGARLPRTRGRPSAVARRRPAAAPRARARPRRAQRDARAARACRRSSASTAASATALCLVATFPQLEYPRAWPPAHARRRAAAVGAAGRRRRAAAGRRAARARRAVDLAGRRRSGCCAPRSRAWPSCRCACSRRPTAPAPTRRSRCPPTPGSSTGSPTRARCRPATLVVCHGGHGTVARALASGCARRHRAGGRRHERERGARRLGRRRRAAAAPAAWRARARSRWRSAARSPVPRLRARARGARRPGPQPTTAAVRGAELVEEFASGSSRNV